MRHSTKSKQAQHAGFTLLELMVVVSIIGFLSSVSIVALSASKSKNRDTQRKLDQVTIIKAVELYTNDFGVPPTQVQEQSVSLAPNRSELTGRARADLNSTLGIGIAQAACRIQPCSYCENWNQRRCMCEWDPFCYGGGGDPVCGNQILENGEVCDQPDFGGQNVETLCPSGGTPTCAADCQSYSCVSICGNGVIDPGEVCDRSNFGTESCATRGYYGGSLQCSADCKSIITSECNNCGDGSCISPETQSTCPIDCGTSICNNNEVCEGSLGENISNCPNDCKVGDITSCVINGKCDPGETPGNCPSDCSNYSICYVSGEWNLCCLFGGTYCSGSGSGASSGYYGVCNVDRCEQKYLLQPPATTCASDIDCTPNAGEPSRDAEKFVSSGSTTINWLKGLEPYVVSLPTDPGHHTDPKYDLYYASSHPDIVKNHKFCVWVSYERVTDNFNPYNDINTTPTGIEGDELLKWTPLCVQ